MNAGRWRRVFMMLIACAMQLGCHAAAAALTLSQEDGKAHPFALEPHVDMLVDPSAALPVEQVLAPERQAGFEPAAGKLFQGYTKSVIWLRFTLQREPDAPQKWFIRLRPTWLDDIRLYSIGADGMAHLLSRAGDRMPYAQRDVPSGVPTFQIDVEPQPRSYLLRVQSHGAVALELALMQADAMAAEDGSKAIYLAAAAGAISIMVLMNLVFWAWLRESTYLFYAVFLASVLGVASFGQGYAGALVLPNQGELVDRLTDVAYCLFLAAVALFAARFFEFRQHSKWMSRITGLAVGLYAIGAVMALFGDYSTAIEWVYVLGMCLAGLHLLFLFWLVVVRRQYLYVLPAALFCFFIAAWIAYGVMLANYISPVRFALVESLTTLTSVASLAVLNITIASRSRRAEERLKEERIKTLESMRVAKNALEERVRQREFVAMVSHEFRTPLAIVKAVTQALEVSPSGADSRVRESTRKIQKAVHRLSMLIENILQDAAIETASPGQSVELFDLKEIVRGLRSVGLPDDEGRLQIRLPDSEVTLTGQSSRVEMALRNLVQNALKYSHADSLVTVSLSLENGLVRVDVLNIGDPIPRAEADKLFEKYFRGRSSSRVPGSGLGLHIARAIARQHHGDIVLMSSDARCTHFRFWMPR